MNQYTRSIIFNYCDIDAKFVTRKISKIFYTKDIEVEKFIIQERIEFCTKFNLRKLMATILKLKERDRFIRVCLYSANSGKNLEMFGMILKFCKNNSVREYEKFVIAAKREFMKLLEMSR